MVYGLKGKHLWFDVKIINTIYGLFKKLYPNSFVKIILLKFLKICNI